MPLLCVTKENASAWWRDEDARVYIAHPMSSKDQEGFTRFFMNRPKLDRRCRAWFWLTAGCIFAGYYMALSVVYFVRQETANAVLSLVLGLLSGVLSYALLRQKYRAIRTSRMLQEYGGKYTHLPNEQPFALLQSMSRNTFVSSGINGMADDLMSLLEKDDELAHRVDEMVIRYFKDVLPVFRDLDDGKLLGKMAEQVRCKMRCDAEDLMIQIISAYAQFSGMEITMIHPRTDKKLSPRSWSGLRAFAHRLTLMDILSPNHPTEP